MAIKPSGVDYASLRAQDIVVLALDSGQVVAGGARPSSDTPTHLHLYRAFASLGGVIHTHSNYATSFAALGEPIPAVLTAMADEFGGPIPCAPYCQIGEEEIGQAVVEHIGDCPAILLQNHGVFAVGPTPEAAFKAAVMVEDVAKTVHLAMLRGKPIPIPDAEVKRAHKRYVEKYGQK